MALPWLLVCVGEWAVLRTWFRRDLEPSGTVVTDSRRRAALRVRGARGDRRR